jgi:predicted O-methyltransferase YrrM
MKPVLDPYVVAESAWRWPPNPRHAVRRYLRDSWLARVVLAVRPTVMVETGVSLGRSATVLLAASAIWNGRLHSIDIAENTPDGLPVGRLVPPALRDRWRLTTGDSETALPELLDRIGTIDLFFHDSDHTERTMLREYCAAWSHLRDGGALVSDDIKANGTFHRFAENVGRRAEIWYSPYGEQGAIFA